MVKLNFEGKDKTKQNINLSKNELIFPIKATEYINSPINDKIEVDLNLNYQTIKNANIHLIKLKNGTISFFGEIIIRS